MKISRINPCLSVSSICVNPWFLMSGSIAEPIDYNKKGCFNNGKAAAALERLLGEILKSGAELFLGKNATFAFFLKIVKILFSLYSEQMFGCREIVLPASGTHDQA